MRRLIQLIALSVLLLGSFLAGGAAASAATSGQVAVNVCAKASAYPPSSGAMVMASTTTPYTGQKIEVSGSNYCPDEDVTITIGRKTVGHAHTDRSGAFDPKVTVSVPPGSYPLTGTGARGDHASLTLTVRSRSAVEPISVARPNGRAGAAAAPQGGGGGLAFTGVDIALLAALAALLLTGGGYLLYAGRRRHTARL